jgi:hypothetical protein
MVSIIDVTQHNGVKLNKAGNEIKNCFPIFYILLPVFCTTANSWCVRFESPCICFIEFYIDVKVCTFEYFLNTTQD